jgi:hypothetical protein
MNRKPLFLALISTALLLILHLYALQTYFYWYHRWFDIPMHLLGGAAVGAFVLAFFNVRRMKLYFFCMLAVVVGWEVFENLAQISTGQPNYWTDTIGDMANGLIGAVFSYVVAKRGPWR